MVNERLIPGQGMSSMILSLARVASTMLYFLIFLFVASKGLFSGFTAWVFRGPVNRTAPLVLVSCMIPIEVDWLTEKAASRPRRFL